MVGQGLFLYGKCSQERGCQLRAEKQEKVGVLVYSKQSDPSQLQFWKGCVFVAYHYFCFTCHKQVYVWVCSEEAEGKKPLFSTCIYTSVCTPNEIPPTWLLPVFLHAPSLVRQPIGWCCWLSRVANYCVWAGVSQVHSVQANLLHISGHLVKWLGRPVWLHTYNFAADRALQPRVKMFTLPNLLVFFFCHAHTGWQSSQIKHTLTQWLLMGFLEREWNTNVTDRELHWKRNEKRFLGHCHWW